MLRLATFEMDGDAQGALAVPPALLTQALGDLASERAGQGGAGFAIEQFCVALVGESPRRALAYVDRLVACGVALDAIYDTYIPRAAARLGELWVEDRIGFTDVTLGMARLTEVFRRLSPAFLRERRQTDAPCGRALFALAPGEAHALGVVMAADHFQRAGWSVRVELLADAARLERIARDQPFDLIGLSAGSRRMIPALRETVARLRRAAAPATRFAVGGPLVALDPDVAPKVGADIACCVAADALAALRAGA